MNRIDKLFVRKKSDVLAVYFTAGFPDGENVSEVVAELAEAGIDLVEVGMPFSDPLADGPVIQESSKIALEKGMNLTRLFSELRTLRAKTDVPVVLMGYLNPVLQFGMERFLSECRQCGVDGIILPDLPVEEFMKVRLLFEAAKVYPVFLVTPDTPQQRIRLISNASKGFVYVVASSSTTGGQTALEPADLSKLSSVLKQIKDRPTLVGFGIHDRKTFEAVTKEANGGVVGSAFIRELKNNTVSSAIDSLMRRLKIQEYDHTA